MQASISTTNAPLADTIAVNQTEGPVAAPDQPHPAPFGGMALIRQNLRQTTRPRGDNLPVAQLLAHDLALACDMHTKAAAVDASIADALARAMVRLILNARCIPPAPMRQLHLPHSSTAVQIAENEGMPPRR